MATPAEVLSALQAQLQNSANLSYVKDENIFIGARDGITFFPCICIEREEMNESEYAYPVARLTMVVQLIILIKTEQKDYQLIGDGTNVKGTLDVENDVKLAIDSDRTLGGEAIHTEIQDSQDGVQEYPVRSVNLRLSILFQQTRSVRT